MNILVIGGTRYFGIHMVNKLLEQGYNITIATRGKTPDSYGDRVKRIIIERTNEESMRKVLQGKYFDVVIGENDVKKSKPDPEGILCALKKLNCREGYYIGDNVTDIQAGKRAGVKTVGVKWSPKGYQFIEKENPDLLINDYKEFMEYIKENELC